MMIQQLLRTVFRVTKSTVVIFTTSTVLVFLLSKLPFAPDYITVNEKGTNLLPIPLFRGSLQENDILSQASKLFHGQLQGPETLVPYEGKNFMSVKLYFISCHTSVTIDTLVILIPLNRIPLLWSG